MTESKSGFKESVFVKYKKLNSISRSGASVFFGSTLLSEIPVCELLAATNLNEVVYNRSISELKINDAQQFLQTCIFDLCPNKLFIEIGEEDLSDMGFKIDDFISRYEWLLYLIHKAVKTKIHVISTFGHNAETVNVKLKKLALESGCEYIDISDIYGDENFEAEFINRIKFFLRNGNIGFYEAMNYDT